MNGHINIFSLFKTEHLFCACYALVDKKEVKKIDL